MTPDTEVARAESRGVESFWLLPDEMRFVADWASPGERVRVELPGDVAGLVCQRRAEGTPMLFCTWSPDCDEPGQHRMERRANTTGLTVVEIVCDQHTQAARSDGYEPREAAADDDNTAARS